MRRRHTSASSMSLFPFLDTLVCTMGALILMLLAMTPRIKERALARQAALAPVAAAPVAAEPESEPEPPAETVAAPPAVDFTAERQRRHGAWLRQAADARSAVAAKQADFQRRRRQLKESDQQLRDVQDLILKTQLKSENAENASASLDDRAAQLDKQAAVIAQRIAETRKKIDLTNRRQAAAKNEYALVAYDGTSGTQRRPIYIECTGKGFRFLPENETVSPVDLEGFTDGFNPLLAGAQTLVRFWARRRRSGGPAEPEPYVLLVVRPSGCFTYYLARKFLSSLGVHWGYELIEEDWTLNIPDPDPVAKSMLRETLDATVKIRRPPQRAVAIGERDFGGPFDPRDFDDDWLLRRGAGDGRGGSGPGKAGPSGSGRNPGVTQGYATRNDRSAGDKFPGDRPLGSPGIGEGPDRERSGLPTGLQSPGKYAAGAGGGGGGGKSMSGTGSHVGAGTPNGTGAAGIDGRTVGQAMGGAVAGGSGGRMGGTGAAGAEGRGGGARDTALASDSAARGGAGGAADAAGNLPANSVTGAAGQAATGNAAGAGSGRGTSPKSKPATLAGTSDSDAPGEGGEGDSPLPTGFVGDDTYPENLPSSLRGRGAGGEGASANGSRDRRGGSPLTPNPSPTRGEGDTNPEATGADPAKSVAGAEGAGGASSRPSWLSDPADENSTATGESPRARMGGPGIGIGLGGAKKKSVLRPDDANDGPRVSENDGKRLDGPAGRSYGPRKWGQAGRRAGIGYEKKVKIYLNDKRIFVDARQNLVTVAPSDSGEEVINRVVSLIDQVADSWGEPPSKFYWVPVVDFVVYPGGNANYARLQSALEQKWGVSTSVRYAGEGKDKAKQPATGGRK